MDFSSAISICFKKYFDFSGRASRSEFWYFVLFVSLLLFGAGLLLGIFMPTNQSLDGVVTLFIYLPLIIPIIAVMKINEIVLKAPICDPIFINR